MLTGAGSPCTYRQGSQLAAAVAFIRTHRSQVALITIDIGANDVDGCATATTINQTCVTAGIASVEQNLPLILGALRDAAGPRTVIAGMNLYDPFLADYLAGPAGQAAATQSVTLADTDSKAAIYYTVDGSIPSASSHLYSAPLNISVSTSVRAIAISAA